MQMHEASRRAIGRFDGQWAALNSEDEAGMRGQPRCWVLFVVVFWAVAREEVGWRMQQDGPALLWFCGPASSHALKPQQTGPTGLPRCPAHLRC